MTKSQSTPQTEPWTINRLLTWTTDYFRQSGSQSPRLDAEVLLAHACSCQRIELYTAFDQVPEQAVVDQFREFIRRRSEGTPVAYLVGYREFYSLDFKVSPAVLIPRPETEFLVVAAIDLVKQSTIQGHPIQIADIGTGSGAIAVTIAKNVAGCRITATDISRGALDIARENAATHDVGERIDFVECDLFGGLSQDQTFDYVLSNPPYIGESERGELSTDVLDHEPSQALFAGPDGTEVIRRLVPAAAERLLPGGWLLIEISPKIQRTVCQLIDETGAFEMASITKDLSGLARVVQSRRRER